MELSLLLPPSHFIFDLDEDSPENIIRALAKPLYDEGIIRDLDSFTADVLEREQIYTTQIMDDVAFPHAHAEQVAQISLVVGHARGDGLTFAPNTPCKCRLFFLIAVPACAPEAHLELMANLVDFVMSDKLPAALAAKTPDDLLKLFAAH